MKQQTTINSMKGAIDMMKTKKNNMAKQIFITIAVVFSIISLTGSAFAWGGGGCGRGKARAYESYGQEWAKLTDDQRTKIEALHQKFTDETAAARAGIAAKHAEIKILMETTSPDKARLHALAAELSDLKKQVMDKKIDLALEVKKTAPALDIAMGFHGGGGGCMMMGMDKDMNGGCGMMGMMGKKHGMGQNSMKDMGMGKMNCPAMNAEYNNSSDNSEQPQKTK